MRLSTTTILAVAVPWGALWMRHAREERMMFSYSNDGFASFRELLGAIVLVALTSVALGVITLVVVGVVILLGR